MKEALKLALKALYENTQYSMRGDPIAYQDQRNDDIIKAIKEALAQPDNTSKLYEELRVLIDGGSESFTHNDAVQYLKDNLAPLKWTPEDTAYRPGGVAQPYPEYDRGFSNGWDKCAERQATQPVQSEHPEQMARLGWQYVECPACGSEGARAFPKPEQEPVAWLRADGMKAMEADEKESWIEAKRPELVAEYTLPLFTSPPQRQPLTDAEIWQIELGLRQYNIRDTYDLSLNEFARAIEAAHGIGDET